ncbi:MAG TPA: aldo/keto reductase [Candidatus Ozemobacteraceae bacterium]|nr:aldo/keto reductase [Candidatus Ozemobacteraceae bacterium]
MTRQPSSPLADLCVQDIRVPAFLYGTAWKEGATAELVELALGAGFRGIDTANQRQHYYEAGVGEALSRAFAAGTLSRDDLFLQSKFTFRPGQDSRLPYDPDAPKATQVRQSMDGSLGHLRVERLDSYLLHGLSTDTSLTDDDEAAWRAMEELKEAGKTHLIGVSNVSIDQLEELFDLADVPPAFVQNRCFASLGWDAEVRAFCGAQGIVYQGFSLLTANQRELAHPDFMRLVARTGKTAAQVVFRFARELGIIPLSGTTSLTHMRADLDLDDIRLTPDDIDLIENIAF